MPTQICLVISVQLWTLRGAGCLPVGWRLRSKYRLSWPVPVPCWSVAEREICLWEKPRLTKTRDTLYSWTKREEHVCYSVLIETPGKLELWAVQGRSALGFNGTVRLVWCRSKKWELPTMLHSCELGKVEWQGPLVNWHKWSPRNSCLCKINFVASEPLEDTFLLQREIQEQCKLVFWLVHLEHLNKFNTRHSNVLTCLEAELLTGICLYH